MNKSELTKLIGSILNKPEFIKSKYGWVKLTQDLGFCVELQKSSFSNSYYINIYTMIRNIDLEGWDPSKIFRFDTTIGCRIEKILRIDNKFMDSMLKLEDEKDEEQVEFIQSSIKSLKEYLNKISTEKDLVNLSKNDDCLTKNLRPDAKNYLGLS